jgi:hypothetical protein
MATFKSNSTGLRIRRYLISLEDQIVEVQNERKISLRWKKITETGHAFFLKCLRNIWDLLKGEMMILSFQIKLFIFFLNRRDFVLIIRLSGKLLEIRMNQEDSEKSEK